MSQATVQEKAPGTATPGQTVTLANVIRSEWIKFHTLKSMMILLLIAGLVEVILAAVTELLAVSQPPAGTYSQNISMAGQLASVAVAIMAVLTMTSEYSSMSIRSTLTAVPTRLPVLYAKLIVVAVTTFLVMAVFTLITFGAAWWIGHTQVSETPAVALDGFFAIVIMFTATSVICFFIGVTLRSTSGALGICIGLIFLPIVLSAFPTGGVVTDVLRFLPFAGLTNIATYGFETHYRPWYYVSAIGWVVVSGIIATWLFKKRDA